jgi:hypothetical protein
MQHVARQGSAEWKGATMFSFMKPKIMSQEKAAEMFDVIKHNITPYEAKEMYLNDHIVMLYPKKCRDGTKGDVIYVGDSDGAWAFTKIAAPPEGYTYSMLQGINFEELAPLVVF